MKRNYNTEITDFIGKVFNDINFKYQFDEERGIYRFVMSLDGPITNINCAMVVRNEEILTYGISPLCADNKKAEMMAKMAEFITRANYSLKNGCFEMDYRDGELRYRIYTDCDGVMPSEMVILDCIHVCATTFKRYAPGIVSMIFTDKSPADAIKECEDDREQQLAQLAQLIDR